MPAERLIDGLYGDSPPAGAANALQSQVSRLRQALGSTRRSSSTPAGTGSRWRRMTWTRTGSRGSRRTGSGRWAWGPRRGGRRAAGGPGAVAGAALADAPHAAGRAARLEELRLTAVEDRVEAELGLGAASGQLIAELRDLVGAEPLRERPRALLMRALYGAGRPAEALSAYEDARQVFADELGTDPSPEMAALHVAILRDEVARPPGLPGQLTSFVGREEELRRVGKLLGEARLVTLHGPGGAGKTRLAVEAAGRQDGEVCFVELAGLHPGPATAVSTAPRPASAATRVTWRARCSARSTCAKPACAVRPTHVTRRSGLSRRSPTGGCSSCSTTASMSSPRRPGSPRASSPPRQAYGCWPRAASRWASPARRCAPSSGWPCRRTSPGRHRHVPRRAALRRPGGRRRTRVRDRCLQCGRCAAHRAYPRRVASRHRAGRRAPAGPAGRGRRGPSRRSLSAAQPWQPRGAAPPPDPPRGRGVELGPARRGRTAARPAADRLRRWRHPPRRRTGLRRRHRRPRQPRRQVARRGPNRAGIRGRSERGSWWAVPDAGDRARLLRRAARGEPGRRPGARRARRVLPRPGPRGRPAPAPRRAVGVAAPPRRRAGRPPRRPRPLDRRRPADRAAPALRAVVLLVAARPAHRGGHARRAPAHRGRRGAARGPSRGVRDLRDHRPLRRRRRPLDAAVGDRAAHPGAGAAASAAVPAVRLGDGHRAAERGPAHVSGDGRAVGADLRGRPVDPRAGFDRRGPPPALQPAGRRGGAGDRDRARRVPGDRRAVGHDPGAGGHGRVRGRAGRPRGGGRADGRGAVARLGAGLDGRHGRAAAYPR
ncbi:BTAD domain-containing putative transcriptional regulator [Phytohabitans flavus]|uniref:BTAD domain-containing putative transcriptional regulator n=1 Tax=Phytohabitans flavus TaxID=1076124 RepID=UPI00363FBA30